MKSRRKPDEGLNATMDIAVVGTGIAGLGAAWLLNQRHSITVFEEDDRLGGHSNTVEVAFPNGQAQPVDTGFIVYNSVTYPNLVQLFGHLDVQTQASDMSFSVSLDDGRLEYAGDETLGGLLAQPSNLVNPAFLGMVADILRFFRQAPRALHQPGTEEISLGDWLAAQRYGETFTRDHLLPMAAAIWSAPFGEVLRFPMRSFVRFFHNHGLLALANRPRWRTVTGGSRAYVEKLTNPFRSRIRTGCKAVALRRIDGAVALTDRTGTTHRFDHVVLACHGDQALRIIMDADIEEQRLLSAFRYQTNRAVLHRDDRLMPKRRRVWCSWNYLGRGLRAERASGGVNEGVQVSVTYWMNRLQSIDAAHPLFVTLNPIAEPAPDQIIRELSYDHPIFDAAAVDAQGKISRIQGRGGVWYCGAHLGYGFHEDGLSAGLAVAEALGCQRPWTVEDMSPAGRHATPSGPLPNIAPIAAE